MGASPPILDVKAHEPHDLESTQRLVARAQDGDRAALDALLARHLPALQRFAHGRLPPRARRICDTGDLIQDTLVRALGRFETFGVRRQGSFLAWLKRILVNRLTDVVRSAPAGAGHVEIDDNLPDSGRSLLEEAVGHEQLEMYERALAELAPHKQDAIILFVEMGCSYTEIATAMGKRSSNTARMLTQRALRDLISQMRALGAEP